MNIFNTILTQKVNSFHRLKTVESEPDKEDTMEEKCTVCGAESQADCKCPDDCPSCGA